MPEITITHPDGSTDTIPQTRGWTRRREVGKMRKVTATVDRVDAKAANLQPKHDELQLGSIDTVRLVDVEKGGSSWRLVGYSFEWDANRVEPTPGGDLREGSDDVLISGLVSEVPSWTAGTINSYTSGLSFVLNHAHRHEAIRRVERNVPGEIRFRDAGTVDYVQSLGSDKTASVEISSAAGTLEDEISITNRGRELDGTHVRVLGAHEGEAQLYANLVPSSDPATYENRVDYTTSRWSSGDARDWDTWANKDVSDQATIEAEAAALGDEITEELVEVEATVSGVDIDVGDWVRVVKPDADLDRDMRVHRVKTVAEGAKVVDKVLLSTRTVMRQGDGDDLKDIQRFNKAFQGSAVILQGGGSRQPVNGTLNAFVPFRYPAVDYEHTVEIEVRGLNYRHYSSPASHDHTVSIGDHSHSVTIPNHSHDVTITVPEHTHFVSGATLDTGSTDSHTHTYIGPQNTSQGGWNTSGVETQTTETSTSDNGGGTTETTSNGGGFTSTTDATAGVIPGIEQTTDTPSNCDVIVNGSTIATNIGSGTFQATVDASGVLNKGAWNEIEVSSDTLGHVIVTVYAETYKQIGKQ